MAISKEKKQEIVAELKELLPESKAVVISDYRGLSAEQMAALRNKLRPVKGRFLVAKNSLVLRSLREVGLPEPTELLQGPSALGVCFEDISPPLKALMEFAKETELLTIKGGLMGDRVLSAEDVATLSDLPAPEVLQAQLLSGLQAPASGLVGVLDGVLRSLLYVLNARSEQLGEATA